MKKNNSGVALVTVMCFAFIISVLIAGLMLAGTTHLRIARDQIYLEQALYVAQAGAERAAVRLSQGASLPLTFDGELGDGSFCVVVIDGATPAAGWHTVAGSIAINPNSSPDHQFAATLPNGTVITKADLGQDFPGYIGSATNVFILPKGGGSQNGLMVDGEVYPLENSKTYNVFSPVMTINIFNEKVNKQGKALGRWHIAMATTQAHIDVTP